MTEIPIVDDHARSWKFCQPEALLPLDSDAERVRVLLLFDGPKEGAPRSLEVPLKPMDPTRSGPCP